jgi:hypothetical protein
MSEIRITKSRHLLDRAAGPGHGLVAMYAAQDGDTGGEADPKLFITADDYAALGSPQQITVTIEPGDRLNDGEVPA